VKVRTLYATICLSALILAVSSGLALADSCEFVIGEIAEAPPDSLRIPIHVSTDIEAYGLQFTLDFPDDLLDVVAVQLGELTQDMILNYNVDRNLMYCAIAGITPITGEGTVAYVDLVTDTGEWPGGECRLLSLKDTILNEVMCSPCSTTHCFSTTVSLEATTWGSVKSLYR
jgi:hypothetical protein